jgi:cobalt-zinc-cadmium resistance protein CzcA
MVQLDVTGSLMSLGAIDFGLLVDGAIVMLEAVMVRFAVRNRVKVRLTFPKLWPMQCRSQRVP